MSTNKITIQENLLPSLGYRDVFSNGIKSGRVELFDFARANSSYEARVQAVTKVASICYGNPKGLGSINLFNRLQAEAAGLPSSSYEFVPVLINLDFEAWYHKVTEKKAVPKSNCLKYGEILQDKYLLTNLRALINDVGPEESLNYLNTSEEEIQIIRDNVKTFLFDTDLSTRSQMQRHRQIWQELSRRYVSGKRQAFEFYIDDTMSKVTGPENIEWDEQYQMTVSTMHTTQSVIDLCVEHYYKAIEQGARPEQARRILPQGMMTRFWGAFNPTGLDNFFTLRLDSHAQLEIRQIARAMKELIDEC